MKNKFQNNDRNYLAFMWLVKITPYNNGIGTRVPTILLCMFSPFAISFIKLIGYKLYNIQLKLSLDSYDSINVQFYQYRRF